MSQVYFYYCKTFLLRLKMKTLFKMNRICSAVSLRHMAVYYVLGFVIFYLVWYYLLLPHTYQKTTAEVSKPKSEKMAHRKWTEKTTKVLMQGAKPAAIDGATRVKSKRHGHKGQGKKPLKPRRKGFGKKSAQKLLPGIKPAKMRKAIRAGANDHVKVPQKILQGKAGRHKHRNQPAKYIKPVALEDRLKKGPQKGRWKGGKKNVKAAKEEIMSWKNKHKKQKAFIDKVLSNKKQKQAFLKPVKFVHGAAMFDVTWPLPGNLKVAAPRIPSRIHQMWVTEKVPSIYKPWIDSVLQKHTLWDYKFWTQKEAEELVSKKYPQAYRKLSMYTDSDFRRNILKYFILHTYGGVFVDMKTEALKALDFWIHMSDFVVSHQNYEQTFYVEKKGRPYLSDQVIGSRPRHQFLRTVIRKLPKKSVKRFPTTGEYLTAMYRLYLKSNSSRSSQQNVLVIHPKYWCPTWPRDKTPQVKKQCKKVMKRKGKHDGSHQHEVCKELMFNQFENKERHNTFLMRHWEVRIKDKGTDTFNLKKYVKLSKRKHSQRKM